MCAAEKIEGNKMQLPDGSLCVWDCAGAGGHGIAVGAAHMPRRSCLCQLHNGITEDASMPAGGVLATCNCLLA